MTIHALQIFLIKATAYCFKERKIKYRPTENIFLGRVGEVAKDKTFSLSVMSFVAGVIARGLQGHQAPVESCGFVDGSCLQKVELDENIVASKLSE